MDDFLYMKKILKIISLYSKRKEFPFSGFSRVENNFSNINGFKESYFFLKCTPGIKRQVNLLRRFHCNFLGSFSDKGFFPPSEKLPATQQKVDEKAHKYKV